MNTPTHAPYHRQATPPRLENINRHTGYVPPPRFQQLRSSSTSPSNSPPSMAPIASQSPNQAQGHSRSSSFFSFRSNKDPHNSPPHNNNIHQPTPNVLRRPSAQPQTISSPAYHQQPQSPRMQAQPAYPQQQYPQEQQQQQQHQHQQYQQQLQQQQQQQLQQQQQQQHQQAQAVQAKATVGPSPLSRQPSSTQGSSHNSQQPLAASTPGGPSTTPLHPEIHSVVKLTIAHAHKIYFSGPLVRRIERQPDGQRPAKDEGWTNVWAQLGGTTLSIWDQKELDEAVLEGREVPPAYVNVTDAFVQVLGSVTVPGVGAAPAKKYTNVLTVNTAGSNLMLFSCPDARSLLSWAAALRLSAWEKSRLEEIYTAHLIRITLNSREMPSTLIRGRMEGWTRIRIAGQTDWKRVWMVIVAGTEQTPNDQQHPSNSHIAPPHPKRKRMSSLFSRDSSPPHGTIPQKASITAYTSPKPKDKKKPLLTIREVSQAFAVYPERPELISRSTLIKIEGMIGDEEVAGQMRSREGWTLIMPELEGGVGQSTEMLKWIVALHDAFELYGRPEAWTWDPRDPVSLMFSYPVGPEKDQLFLDREEVEQMDPRDDRTSAIRSRLLDILLEKSRKREPPRIVSSSASNGPPSLPPIGEMSGNPVQQENGNGNGNGNGIKPPGPQLPPLDFNRSNSSSGIKAPLTPITERSSINTHGGRTLSLDAQSVLGAAPSMNDLPALPDASESERPAHEHTILDGPMSQSPTPQSPPPGNASNSNPLNGRKQSLSSPKSPENDVTSKVSSSPPPRSPSNKPDPSNIQLPLSPTEEKSPTHSFNNNSPSIYAASQTPVGQSSNNISPTQANFTSNHRPSSPTVSMLTSPHSMLDDRRLLQRQDTVSSTTNGSIFTSPYSPTETERPIHSADRMSMLTSPHSINESEHRADDRMSVLTSPYSIHGTDKRMQLAGGSLRRPTSSVIPPLSPSQQVKHEPSHEDTHNLLNSPGALYYMQNSQSDTAPTPMQIQQTNSQSENDSDAYDGYSSQPPASIAQSSSRYSEPSSPDGEEPNNSGSRPVRRSTPMAFMEMSSPPTAQQSTNSNLAPQQNPADRLSPIPSLRAGLGRKPSGARAPVSNRSYAGGSISSQQLTEEDETQSEISVNMNHQENSDAQSHSASRPPPPPPHSVDDLDSDALAALSYLDVNDDQSSAPASSSKVEPLKVRQGVVSPQPKSPPPPPPEIDQPFKSSFAPSKQAAERKAKVQAQQAAHHVAVHKPGRANGKRKASRVGGWQESSEEEEEEEEEDDGESDGEPPLTRGQNTPSSGPASLNTSMRPPQQNQYQATEPQQQYSHLRPPRTLPQIPGSRPMTEHHAPVPRRLVSDPYSEASRRTYYEDGTQIRSQAEMPKPGAARQSLWSQVLDPGRAPGAPPGPSNSRDTFVQLEPSEAMTKAFTPQGLLSAGIQDKDDRSAKRQEELARETGASLINVPNKPPPPQTGLLGAITAHERERKREGGVGAALTEREREKRLAEERQRRFDDTQRQQLEQLQQTGSMYGSPYPGFNPMMANPMMMGMNPMMALNPMMTGGGMTPMMTGGAMQPMMTGGAMQPMMTGGAMQPMMTGQMGFPGMMPGYNPQHMFAAQQAAQAYQQAMMAFSVAGSQAGGDAGTAPQLNPAMTGGSMAGYDPRMSMMGMPMMGMPQMGSPQMGGPQMGSPQMGAQQPLSMQMTGLSGFDARFSPGGTPGVTPPANNTPQGMNNPNLLPPNAPGGQNQAQFSSRNSSPAGRGSPLARANNFENRSRPASPKR